jgi:hypothetical protein
MKPRTAIGLGILMAVLAVPTMLFAQQGKSFGTQKSAKIIPFDVPGAGTGANQGTFPYGINPAGAIIGWYADVNNVNHGFLRDAWGGTNKVNHGLVAVVRS